jgi:hypothetical protein
MPQSPEKRSDCAGFSLNPGCEAGRCYYRRSPFVDLVLRVARLLRGKSMVRWIWFATVLAATFVLSAADSAEAQQAYGRAWGNTYTTLDWDRFYHYPYVFYPQNFWGNEYYRSADSLYHRYPPEMRIPVYNRHWHNYYPTRRKYHSGHHFILDVF